MKYFAPTIILGVIGLLIGYLIFGRIGNEFIPIGQFFNFSSGVEGFFNKLGNSIMGIDEIRNKILISGAVGAAIGALIGIVKK